MTTLTYPSTVAHCPQEATWSLQRNLTQRRNPLTRRRKTIEHVGALWAVTLIYTPSTHADRAAVEAFWNLALDADNVVGLWHHARPLPRGTLQTNTTSAAASAGASTININATTGLTLKAGDMFSVALTAGGTQLVQVTADITSAGGVMTATAFVPPLAGAVSNGAAVVVNKPTALFRVEEEIVPVTYSPGFAPSFPVTLLESPAW